MEGQYLQIDKFYFMGLFLCSLKGDPFVYQDHRSTNRLLYNNNREIDSNNNRGDQSILHQYKWKENFKMKLGIELKQFAIKSCAVKTLSFTLKVT